MSSTSEGFKLSNTEWIASSRRKSEQSLARYQPETEIQYSMKLCSNIWIKIDKH
ncbi:4361_t:CDS:2 [Funneliformis mosseae]|uniref:4361_t:CDS:1 n=1 Tax=Funneliformis mosseae TaxID=27381 RepID=A0A9N9A601_FUNMO|nr:4361_t:CDS:2 [Funneliformis mosseae]